MTCWTLDAGRSFRTATPQGPCVSVLAVCCALVLACTQHGMAGWPPCYVALRAELLYCRSDSSSQSATCNSGHEAGVLQGPRSN